VGRRIGKFLFAQRPTPPDPCITGPLLTVSNICFHQEFQLLKMFPSFFNPFPTFLPKLVSPSDPPLSAHDQLLFGFLYISRGSPKNSTYNRLPAAAGGHAGATKVAVCIKKPPKFPVAFHA
jgi:hypothetical protein